MPTCFMAGCSRKSKKKKGDKITMHVFPKNPNAIMGWLRTCAIPETDIVQRTAEVLDDKKSYKFRICSSHFSEDQYESSSKQFSPGRKGRLLVGAVPNINLADPGAYAQLELIGAQVSPVVFAKPGQAHALTESPREKEGMSASSHWALRSLPRGLALGPTMAQEGSLGVWCVGAELPSGILFDPLKVEDGATTFQEASPPSIPTDTCALEQNLGWTSFIKQGRSKAQQNVMHIHRSGAVYIRVCHTIEPGSELYFWIEDNTEAVGQIQPKDEQPADEAKSQGLAADNASGMHLDEELKDQGFPMDQEDMQRADVKEDPEEVNMKEEPVERPISECKAADGQGPSKREAEGRTLVTKSVVGHSLPLGEKRRCYNSAEDVKDQNLAAEARHHAKEEEEEKKEEEEERLLDEQASCQKLALKKSPQVPALNDPLQQEGPFAVVPSPGSANNDTTSVPALEHWTLKLTVLSEAEIERTGLRSQWLPSESSQPPPPMDQEPKSTRQSQVKDTASTNKLKASETKIAGIATEENVEINAEPDISEPEGQQGTVSDPTANANLTLTSNISTSSPCGTQLGNDVQNAVPDASESEGQQGILSSPAANATLTLTSNISTSSPCGTQLPNDLQNADNLSNGKKCKYHCAQTEVPEGSNNGSISDSVSRVECDKIELELNNSSEPNGHDEQEGQSSETNGYEEQEEQSSETNGHDEQEGQSSETNGHDEQNGQSSETNGHDEQERQSSETNGYDEQEGQSSETNGYDEQEEQSSETNGHDEQEGQSSETNRHDEQEGKSSETDGHDEQEGQSSETNRRVEKEGQSSETNGRGEQEGQSSETNGHHEQEGQSSETNRRVEKERQSSETNGCGEQEGQSSETNGRGEQEGQSSETNGSGEQEGQGSETNGLVEQVEQSTETNGRGEQEGQISETNGRGEQEGQSSETCGCVEQEGQGSETNRSVEQEGQISGNMGSPKVNQKRKKPCSIEQMELVLDTESPKVSQKKRKRRKPERKYLCHLCGKAFLQICHLRKHEYVHTGEKEFRCPECGKSYASEDNFIGHLLSHRGIRPNKCDQCNKTYATNRDLKEHMLRHSGHRPFECDVCGKSFTRLGAMRAHRNIHVGKKPKADKMFKCTICGKGLASQASLTSHMRIHTGEKPFPCSICGKLFGQVSNLQGHMRLHTGDRRFKCEVCSSAFFSKPDLRRHMILHTGEAYPCSICGKKLRDPHTLRAHERRHTGDLPFKCKQCEKGYTEVTKLRRHEMTHLSEKQYKCGLCDMGYSQLRSLKRHEEFHKLTAVSNFNATVVGSYSEVPGIPGKEHTLFVLPKVIPVSIPLMVKEEHLKDSESQANTESGLVQQAAVKPEAAVLTSIMNNNILVIPMPENAEKCFTLKQEEPQDGLAFTTVAEEVEVPLAT